MTLVAESLDTIKLAWFALNIFSPQIFVDTTGCAFTFLVAKLARCTLVAYVHYPTVSTVSLCLASFYSKGCMSALNQKAFSSSFFSFKYNTGHAQFSLGTKTNLQQRIECDKEFDGHIY
jgi:hypothetical protein